MHDQANRNIKQLSLAASVASYTLCACGGEPIGRGGKTSIELMMDSVEFSTAGLAS